MKYYIPIIIVLLLAGGIWYDSTSEKASFDCFTEKCKADLAFIEAEYAKEWEEYRAAMNTEKVLVDNEIVKAVQKGTKVSYELKPGHTKEEAYPYLHQVATTSVPFPPNIIMDFKMLSATARVQEKMLEKNRCIFNLICPAATDEEKIAALAEIYRD